MTPRSEALAYRIWAVCKDAEWNLSVRDIADRLGDVSWQRVRAVCYWKGWQIRLRRDSHQFVGLDGMPDSRFNNALDDLNGDWIAR